VDEAGGRVTDLRGRPVSLAAGGGADAVVTSNGVLHHEALEVLAGAPARLG